MTLEEKLRELHDGCCQPDCTARGDLAFCDHGVGPALRAAACLALDAVAKIADGYVDHCPNPYRMVTDAQGAKDDTARDIIEDIRSLAAGLKP